MIDKKYKDIAQLAVNCGIEINFSPEHPYLSTTFDEISAEDVAQFLKKIGEKYEVLPKEIACRIEENTLSVIIPKSSEQLLREIEAKLNSDKSHYESRLGTTERYLYQLEALKEKK
jgi:hypothetical protein